VEGEKEREREEERKLLMLISKNLLIKILIFLQSDFLYFTFLHKLAKNNEPFLASIIPNKPTNDTKLKY
jgi:hypothetical protein